MGKSGTTVLHSGVAIGGSRGALRQKKMPKIEKKWEKEGKNQGKEEKIGKKRKVGEEKVRVFHSAPDR